ncbi:MAG: hypothetical protein IPM20_00800 [Gammaproteobacteria bacterium]|nr:hypothetical protein [Gammaproteobacteria bacterium]
MHMLKFPLVLIAACCALTAPLAGAATYAVTNTTDGDPGSFRARVAEANANPGPDTITFNVTGTINIDTPINITDDLIIDGPGITSLTLNSRVTTGFDALLLDSGSRSDLDLEISDLTLQQGASSTRRLIRADTQGSMTIRNAILVGNGNEILASSGGAVAAEGTDVVLENCEIRNFATTYRGAGVLVRATGTETANLSVDNCLFEDNATRGDSGDTVATKVGGAIAAERVDATASAAMEVVSSSFIGNTSTQGGGAIYSNDAVTFDGSYFAGNSVSGGFGGAIYLDSNSGAGASLSNSVVSGNTATSGGGLYLIVRSIEIDNTTFSANQAATGGALFHFIIGTVDIVNSTFSANTATVEGGALYIEPTGPGATDLNMLNVTITGNSAPSGGGIVNDADEAVITAVNTVIAGNSAGSGAEVAGAIRVSYSLIGAAAGDTDGATITELSAGTSLFNTNPLLESLTDNGGQHVGRNGAFPMPTHDLRVDSPLIAAGDLSASFIGLSLPATDQRGTGFPRIRNGGLEIGAIEFGAGLGGGGGGAIHALGLIILALFAGLTRRRGARQNV